MKRYILIAIVLCSLLALGSPAWCYTISGGIDVGSLDSFLTSTNLGNSGNAEQAWLSSLGLGTWTIYDTVETEWDQSLEDPTVWALDLIGTPEYFFIKVGNGRDGFSHLLFDNDADLNYAVIATNGRIRNIGAVSHLGELGGGTSVPEPGMLMLFGSGLLGLGIFGRKKFRK